MKQLSISLAVAAVTFLLTSYLFEAGPFQKGYTLYPALSGMDPDWNDPQIKARLKLISVSTFSLIIGIITYVFVSKKDKGLQSI